MRIKDLVRDCRNSPNYLDERCSGSHLVLRSRSGKSVTIKANHLGQEAGPVLTKKILRAMREAGFLQEEE